MATGTMATTTTRTATFDEIYVRDSHHAWARLLWEPNGRVIILSDYGNWSFFWGHRGEGVSVEAFLSGLDEHYMGKKMMGAELMEFSVEATVQLIREHITRDRRDGSLDAEQARYEWELSEELESGEKSFDCWFHATGFSDAWEFSSKEICSEWANFWRRLWIPLIQPHLAELSK